MRILGHFSFYLRIHDNMFTVLGGFRSPNKNHSALCVCLLFFPWRPFQDKQRERSVPELTQ